MVATASAADLKARYPEFTPVDDALITLVIAEAAPMIDDGWEVSDQKPGILALAAHLLSMEGWPKRSALPAGSPVPATAGRQVLMRKVGDVTTQYAQTGSASGGGPSGLLSQLTLTPYGNRFRQLLKLNAPAIALV